MAARISRTLRAKLATEKRTRKQKDLSRDELRQLWEAQLSKSERASLRQLSEQPKHDAKEEKHISVGEAVQWAEEHLFDRNSVVLECQVWQEALGRARGESFSVSELKEFTQRRGYIRDEARPGEVTLREVLLREWEIVQTAKEGVGDCHPLVANPRPANPQLDDEQRQALECLAAFNEQAFLFFAAARARAKVLSCANWWSNCGSLAGAWSSSRRNVSKSWRWRRPDFRRQRRSPIFSSKRELADSAVIVVDEAGQIGGRQMLELVRLIHERHGRLVLSGDTRQHGAVEASDALLAIERHAGVKPVELHKIRRQDPALGRDVEERKRIRLYRKAVEAAAAGKLGDSFERLDKMGAIVACGIGRTSRQARRRISPARGAKRFGGGCLANVGRSASRQLARA